MNNLISIFEINETDLSKILLNPNEPHKHEFEELIIGDEGIVEHFIVFEN